MSTIDHIYPKIPTALLEDTRENFCYKRILNINQELTQEIDKYKSGKKRYQTMQGCIQISHTLCALFASAIGIIGFSKILSIQIHNILTLIAGIFSLIFTVLENRMGVELKNILKNILKNSF